MDALSRLLGTITVVALASVAALLLFPVIVLLALGYYLVALGQGTWSLLGWMTGRRPELQEEPLQAPHFWQPAPQRRAD